MGWKGGPLKSSDPKLYKLAKARVLGLGYGCGAEKFIVVARKMADLELSLEEAQITVAQFRNSNPKILAFWNQIEMAFKRASLHKEGEPKIFYMQLPSGREMRYLNVSITNGVRAQVTMGGLQKYFWGGKLTENYVQATAREVFAKGLLALHRKGINVAFHVHDEYVCEVDKTFDKEEVIAHVTQCPEWLDGCPLAAEAKDAEFYTK
jgi:DNA polymerase